ncbi:triose-phosphate isomerase [Atopomonas sediminilitoris]|uniref:triose-phosphate isomerase n=1 Tax=Atopomonas sediminilitoris TaxID=2919919 RepID=UPI001F4EE71D|nr:triose-phosphate isomerase [Atopomonas sediminilitoris]MCJ8170718.1 triose-phosphate isomerase [Atopomonas sediminilitoris]
MRRPLVAGNWKMHGSRETVTQLVQSLLQSEVVGVDRVVFPSLIHLSSVVDAVSGQFSVGAQVCASQQEFGAFTGEVAAQQLADLGCQFVLVGHSERRQLFAETDAVVAQKFMAALQAGLIPVLCLGETLAERESEQTEQVVLRQLAAVLDVGGVSAIAKSVLAYEPVWAIGTGLTATPEQAQAVHKILREALAKKDAQVAELVRIVYGGSVKAASAAELFAMPDIDGGLVGGASLNAQEFAAICRAAEQ